VLINITGGQDLLLHEVSEASGIIHDAADSEANIIFGAVLDESLTDEVRITVIATGFTERKEASLPGPKVVPIPSGPRNPQPSKDWRRRIADLRAEGEEPAEEDLDVPAFLRRQAD
jgi:cell division protein FtsZ